MTSGILQIVIPYRDSKRTKAALKYASVLLDAEDKRVRLIHVHVVPYGVPLACPRVHSKHLERRLRSLVRESDVPVSVEIVYARDWEKGLRRVLKPSSTVFLPIRRASWQTSEKRLAARLRKLGHTVVWVDSE